MMRGGSSARSVPPPISTPSASARSASIWARSSALPKLILPPSIGASLPSADSATFKVTNGRPAGAVLRDSVMAASPPGSRSSQSLPGSGLKFVPMSK